MHLRYMKCRVSFPMVQINTTTKHRFTRYSKLCQWYPIQCISRYVHNMLWTCWKSNIIVLDLKVTHLLVCAHRHVSTTTGDLMYQHHSKNDSRICVISVALWVFYTLITSLWAPTYCAGWSLMTPPPGLQFSVWGRSMQLLFPGSSK